MKDLLIFNEVEVFSPQFNPQSRPVRFQNFFIIMFLEGINYFLRFFASDSHHGKETTGSTTCSWTWSDLFTFINTKLQTKIRFLWASVPSEEADQSFRFFKKEIINMRLILNLVWLVLPNHTQNFSKFPISTFRSREGPSPNFIFDIKRL